MINEWWKLDVSFGLISFGLNPFRLLTSDFPSGRQRGDKLSQ